MILLIKILLTLSLLSIVYQDFKNREIDVVSLGIFSFSTLLLSYYQNGLLNSLSLAIYPFLFVIFQLFLLTSIYSIKEKKIQNIFDSKLGWGDIVFWMGLCFMFSIFYFLLFFIISIFVALLYSIVKRYKKIPLAGTQAMCLIILLVINEQLVKTNLYNDLNLINHIIIK